MFLDLDRITQFVLWLFEELLWSFLDRGPAERSAECLDHLLEEGPIVLVGVDMSLA